MGAVGGEPIYVYTYKHVYIGTEQGAQDAGAQHGRRQARPYVSALYVCLICLSYMSALYVCLICPSYMSALYGRAGDGAAAAADAYVSALYVCLICLPYMSA